MLSWIDSHCHLDRYEDPHTVVANARQMGVRAMIAISTHPDTFAHIVPLIHTFPDVFASLGLHPCDAECIELEALSQWLHQGMYHDKVVAIGETGLDNRPTSPTMERQSQMFECHIKASLESGLPLVVHTRDSDDAFLAIMRKVRATWNGGKYIRGVLHCFTGSLECAREVIDWGWKISLSGIVTFRSAHGVHALATDLPLSSLLIETDAPWLAPVPYRGKTNEPAFVVHTAQQVASLRQCSLEELSMATVQNTLDLFTKMTRQT